MILTISFTLFLFAALIAGLSLFRVRPGFQWFMAVGGGFVTWILVILSYPSLSEPELVFRWGMGSNSIPANMLSLDSFSWPFAVAIVTILLGVLLTDIVYAREIDPNTWILGFVVSGAGLLAVMAANPMMLLLGWALLDLVETATLLYRVSSSAQRERVVITFSVKTSGLLVVVFAMLKAASVGESLSFDPVLPQFSGYLMLAAGLRLGVFPPHKPFLEDQKLRRGLGTIIRMVSVAASMVILNRVAQVGLSPGWTPYLLGITILSGLYGAVSWLRASDELDGRPFWVLGVAALAVSAAVRGMPEASQAWGLSLLFSGSLLFLFTVRRGWLLVFPVLGMLGFSGVMFTPSWIGMDLLSGWRVWLSGLNVLILVILIMGYLRFAWMDHVDQPEVERWVWIVYPLGLVLLGLTHFGAAQLLWGGIPPEISFVNIRWWGGLLSLGLAAIFIWISRRWSVDSDTPVVNTVSRSLSFNWIYRFLWWVYRFLGAVAQQISYVLEGEGGVLWAILFVVLMVTMIIQRSGGG